MQVRPFLSLTTGVFSWMVVGLVASSVQAPPVQASPLSSALTRSSSAIAATSGTPVNAVTGTTTEATAENVVGIVKSVKQNQLEIKLPDGQTQLYNAPQSFSTTSLEPGSFVEVTLDAAGNAIQEVKIPSVEKVISGVISNIDGENVTLELADGTQETTVINEATSERMNLAPGVPLTVTSYTGITATKLCPTLLATCCQKPAPPIALPAPPIPAQLEPTGAGDLRQPIPQKW